MASLILATADYKAACQSLDNNRINGSTFWLSIIWVISRKHGPKIQLYFLVKCFQVLGHCFCHRWSSIEFSCKELLSLSSLMSLLVFEQGGARILTWNGRHVGRFSAIKGNWRFLYRSFDQHTFSKKIKEVSIDKSLILFVYSVNPFFSIKC